jgi:hypothetical protein
MSELTKRQQLAIEAVVSAKPNSNAYEVSRNHDGTHKKVISPVLLGS